MLDSKLARRGFCDLKKNKKSTVPWTCVISDLNGEEIVENIYENNFKKEIKKS